MSAPKQTLSHLPLALVPSEAMQKRAEKYQFLFPFQEATVFSIFFLKCQIILVMFNIMKYFPLQSSLKFNIITDIALLLCFDTAYFLNFLRLYLISSSYIKDGVVPTVQRMVRWVR